MAPQTHRMPKMLEGAKTTRIPSIIQGKNKPLNTDCHLTYVMNDPARFTRKVFKSGGSFVVAIPPEIMKGLELKPGDELDIYADRDKIVMEVNRR